MTRRPPPTLAAALAAVLFLAAGCGGSPAHVPTQSETSPAMAAFAYARCMREHGVVAFPDPQVTTDPGGASASIRQMVPQSLVASPQFKTAQKACQAIEPGPQSRGAQGPHKQVLLSFARCLRAHGVADFPDPSAQGALTLQMIRAAGVDLQAPSFLIAGRACVGVTHGAITPAMLQAAVSGRH